MSLFFKITGTEKLENLTKELVNIQSNYRSDRDIEKLNKHLQKNAKTTET